MRVYVIAFLLVTFVHASAETAALEGPIGLSRQQLVLRTDVDGPPPTATVQVNTAQDSYRWVTRTNVPWLEVVPPSGRGPQTLTIRVSPGAPLTGQHKGTLFIRAAQFPDNVRSLEVDYTLNPMQGVSVHGGDNQVLVINQVAQLPFEARVLDGSGKPRSGVPVSFATVVGATKPSSLTVISDDNGMARFRPTPLQYGAVQVTAQAGIAGDAPAHFKAVSTGWASSFAGEGIQAYGGDNGPASQALFNAPFGMAIADQELLVVDYFNHALRRINLQTGIIAPLSGNGKQGFNEDGHLALESVLSGPFGIALNREGDIVFSDYYNNRIRAIDAGTGRVTTLAGNGLAGYSGDSGAGKNASIDVPLDIASDASGNIYLSDWHNHVVRRIDAKTGTIETIAGTGERNYNGEGQARRSALSTPLGLSFDRDDNLYIADYGNNRVRRIDARSGEISTVAGTGQKGFSGDGELAVFARLNRPYNVYADDDGGLFISDAGNHRVRHVDLASGVITTIAGNGAFGYSPAPELAINTEFKGPFSVIKDGSNNLYIAEYFGHRIRKISSTKPADVTAEDKTQTTLRRARNIFGTLPARPGSEDNPAEQAKIALGRALFHEPRLSQDGSISCSSCHPLNNYGMDGLPLARGIHDQVGTRNTPSVFNAALQDSLFWDGRTATVEQQVREPLLHPKEMAMPNEAAVMEAVLKEPRYQQLFAKAFPNEPKPVSFGNLSLAIGAFQRGLLTPNAAIDRFLAGDTKALSEQQLTGLEVFFREGCASCHAGPLLGGQDIHLIRAYPNTPMGDHFEFRKRLGNTHKFKIAPLRNIARTAPYLHDGRYASLKDALTKRLPAYMVREANIRDTVDLAEGELDALIAFLESLTGQVNLEYTATSGR